MLVPSDTVPGPVDGSASGYRRELDRATRTNDYLRVFFSVVLLGYCVSGPGLLIRFPSSFLEGVRLDTLTQFHGYRPAIFALVFLSLSCVIAALARVLPARSDSSVGGSSDDPIEGHWETPVIDTTVSCSQAAPPGSPSRLMT